MPVSPEFVHYCIGSVRIHHHQIRKLLAKACEDIGINPTKGAISVVDLAMNKVRAASFKLSGARVKEVESVLGKEAASALDDVFTAVGEIEEVFGLTAGPSRTQAQLYAAADAITPLLYRARDRFLVWDKATQDIPVPGLMDRPPSIGEFEPYTRPTRSVPVVPPQFPREQVARIVRTKLGIAFGMSLLSYGTLATLKGDIRERIALHAVSEFSPLEAELGAMKDSLRRRGSTDVETAHFVEMASIASDEMVRLHDFLMERVDDRSEGSFDAVVAECKHTVQQLARVLNNADKLIASLGYRFEIPVPEAASPAP